MRQLISRNSSPHMVRRRRRVLAAVLIGTGVAGLLWSGCSVEEHYDTLSLFFDGVPDPNAPRRTIGGGSGAQLAIVSQHSAFEERRCEECHGSGGEFGFVVSGFGELGSDSCLECHMEIFEAHEVIHGPVAQNECLWCHDPHESVYPHLMRDASPPLCLGCHSLELREGPLIPEHEDLDRDCLDCHYAHGGSDMRFLKPGWPVAGEGVAEEAEPEETPPTEAADGPVPGAESPSGGSAPTPEGAAG